MDIDLPKLPKEIEEIIFRLEPENYNNLIFLNNYTSDWVEKSVEFKLNKVLELGCFDKLENKFNITKKIVANNFYKYIDEGDIDNIELEFISWLIFNNKFDDNDQGSQREPLSLKASTSN